jgi:hypothetical protein
MNDITLEKILKQSQFFGLITKAETRAIPLSELVCDMNTYYTFTEILWERYITETKITYTQQIEIQQLKAEVNKLKSILNDNG